MHRGFLKAAAIFAILSVALGAFAAHGLKSLFSSGAVATFETGVRYQFYHVFALFVTAIVYKEFASKLLIWAGRLFIAGIFLFSFSLYFLSIIQGMVLPGYKWVGAITPFGGMMFIIGWVLLLIAFFRKKYSDKLSLI
ncbi:MAG: DUF423 domain-containing protein [Ferruginibacter sp.]